ncbi:MAG: hypothetical protein K2Q12_06260 [Rickettsiales bacterium]|nr:hypothetical protein [Rickettsiales bacterium]
MLRSTVDTASLHRMRYMLSRDGVTHHLMTRDYFFNVFGYPLEGEVGVRYSTHPFNEWLCLRSPLRRVAGFLRNQLARPRAEIRHLLGVLSHEVLSPEGHAPFIAALKKRLPAGGPPMQHLEDAIVLSVRRASYRAALSEGATAALCLGEAIYDAVFCTCYAYYFHEITHEQASAMAYAQAYAETISGVALGRKSDGQETYRPILGGGGYYEYLEIRQSHASSHAISHAQSQSQPPASDTHYRSIHFAPLRLLGGSAEADETTNNQRVTEHH